VHSKGQDRGLETGATWSSSEETDQHWRPVFSSVFVPMPTVDNMNVHVNWQRNNAGMTKAERAVRAYYDCLVVLFASARRWHPEARLILFTTDDVPEWFRIETDALDLEIIAIPFNHQPPDMNSGTYFRSPFYKLDAIDWIALQGGPDEIYLLLDSDEVVVGHIDVSGWAEKLGYLGWEMKDDYAFHGLTVARYAELVARSGLPEPVNPQVVGGEFIAGSVKLYRLLAKEIARIEQLNLEYVRDHNPPLGTEENYYSLALPYLPTENCLAIVTRIWTSLHHRTVSGTERDLLIWHLPVEKGRGFDKAAKVAVDRTSWFWSSPRNEFIEKMGRIMGVTGLSPSRVIHDLFWGFIGLLRYARETLFHHGKMPQGGNAHGPPWK